MNYLLELITGSVLMRVVSNFMIHMTAHKRRSYAITLISNYQYEMKG